MGERDTDTTHLLVRGLPLNFGDARLPERFWSKVQPCPMSGCLIWCAGAIPRGYGRFKWQGQMIVHRVTFRASGRVLGDGYLIVLDHRCRVPQCCNPLHLEQVLQRTNVRRGLRGLLTRACPNGHPYTPENRYVRSDGERAGRTHCRACGNYAVRSTPEAQAWVDSRKDPT